MGWISMLWLGGLVVGSCPFQSQMQHQNCFGLYSMVSLAMHDRQLVVFVFAYMPHMHERSASQGMLGINLAVQPPV